MKAYSKLKRRAILAARKSGENTAQIARAHDCSSSWVRRVIQEHRELGKVGPYHRRFRDRHTAPVRRRAQYIILEDPRISTRELERVLGIKLDLDAFESLKFTMAVSHNVDWYGGLETTFVESPSGNFLTQPYYPSLPYSLDQEVDRLLRGETERNPVKFPPHVDSSHNRAVWPFI